jgi:hypothetical protein
MLFFEKRWFTAFVAGHFDGQITKQGMSERYFPMNKVLFYKWDVVFQ